MKMNATKCPDSPVAFTTSLMSAEEVQVCLARGMRSKRLQVAVRQGVTLNSVFYGQF